MVQNKQSLSTFPASLSSSFSSSVTVPPATTPRTSPSPDLLPPPPSSSTLKSIFGAPASPLRPHSSASSLSMGQVVSRPQLNSTLSPSSAPSSLGVPASNTSSRFKRAFTARRKKSDSATLPSPRLDKTADQQPDDALHAVPPRQLGPKQFSLQLAHVFNKKSAPASPALSGFSLPPPPPPPKHTQHPFTPPARLAPINTNADRRLSVITTSSPIAPALDYIRKSDEHAEQVLSRDLDRSELKDVRRKSDSTLSLRTIRANLGNKTPRPLSLASTHTVVPITKRLSALITDPEFAMAEEDDSPKSETISRCPSASSLRLRYRRSQSLTLGPPLSSMISGPTVSNATMSLEAVTVTLPRSASEAFGREHLATRELATATSSSLPPSATPNPIVRHASAISSLNHLSTSRIERTLPDLPDTPQGIPPPPHTHISQPPPRQTAVSMTSGFAPAAGLARRAVERMGRVWGSKSSISSPLASPLGGPSSSARTALASRTSSSHSEPLYHRRGRHNPKTPSISSTTSSLSDHEGPQLGKRIRGPLRKPPSGDAAIGLVFGRALKTCVEETATDSVLSILHMQHVVQSEEDDAANQKQLSQPSAPLERRYIPALVVRCTQHIFAWGVQEQGLFRVSGRSSHVVKLRAEFDTGADFDIAQANPGDLDPHAVASVFKAYLRELPEPILTNRLLPYFEAAIASERSSSSPQDPHSYRDIQGLRKPPSLSTLGMPKLAGIHPPSESLRKALSSLISRLPQENRDLLLTVTEVINQTAKRSSETKMPLSNLLLVLCPSLSMNPSLLQALCESQGIWNGVHQRKDILNPHAMAESNQSVALSKVRPETEGALDTNFQTKSPQRSLHEGKRFVRPLPSLPLSDGPTSSSTSGASIGTSGCDGISCGSQDTESPLSSSGSATDDSSSISQSSQSGRPVTPTSLNFRLANPHSPPSLSCSTDSSSVPSSSGSPVQLVKPLTLVDECIERQPPHPPIIAEPIPLPIPSLRSAQVFPGPQFQFPGSRDNNSRSPLAHRKSTPCLSFSSSISAEGRSASVASRATRLKKPSLHLLFSKQSPTPSPSPEVTGPHMTSQEDGSRTSSSGSSPNSMVTAPRSRFSYPPVLNTAIDESSISLALGIEDEEDLATSIGHSNNGGLEDPPGSTRSSPTPRRSLLGRDAKFCHLDVSLPEDEQFGGYNWTQSVLMAAGESRW